MRGKSPFGRQLQDLIRRKGVCQYIVAKKLGMTDRALTSWIRGRHQPNYPTLCWLMEVLDMEMWLTTSRGESIKLLDDSFSTCLNHILTEENTTVKEVAEKSGVPLTTLYDYRRGHAEPKLTNLSRILIACRCSIDLRGDNVCMELMI